MSSSSVSPVAEEESPPEEEKPRRIPTITQMVYGRRPHRPEGPPKRPPNHRMSKLEDLLSEEIWTKMKSLT